MKVVYLDIEGVYGILGPDGKVQYASDGIEYYTRINSDYYTELTEEDLYWIE